MAFHGDAAVKASCVHRLRSHLHKPESDQVVFGWHGGTRGVTGCRVHGIATARCAPDLGIPEVLAGLAEMILERLSDEEAKRFSLEFIDAVPVGADLSSVWPAIAHWLLADPEHGVIRSAPTAGTRSAIKRVASLYARMLRSEPVSPQELRNAVQIAGPLGEGAAAQVVSGAAEAASDPVEMARWTVAKACSVAPDTMWPALKRQLIELVQSA